MYNPFIVLLALSGCLAMNMIHAIAPLPETMLSKEFRQEVDHIVNNALQEFNVPGASVSIVFNDQVILSKGYGFRDLHKRLPVTEHTLFPVGSCTKAFTALLLCLLADEGKMALDDPVQKYIPEFSLLDSDKAARLTICDLLAHRTGMPRHDPIWFFSTITRSSVIEKLRHLESVCDLRQDFQYNNLMYAVAGIIVERLTGQSWEESISSRLLEPLEMRHSITSLEELSNRSDFSLPYAEMNKVVTNIPFRNTSSINPAGGIISNALDMANWLKLQLDQDRFSKGVVRKQTLQETHAIHMPLPPSDVERENVHHVGYGLGWCIGKYREYDLVSHGGDIDGFSSEVAFLPEKKTGIVILTNSSTDGRYAVSSIRNRIFDKVLLTGDVDRTSKSSDTRTETKDALYAALERFNRDAQLPPVQSPEDYIGCYLHPAYGCVELTIENDHLAASFGHIKTPLYYQSDNVFIGQFSELLVYGINPVIDFKFFKDSSDTIYRVEIPFEGFRSAGPITFTRTLSN